MKHNSKHSKKEGTSQEKAICVRKMKS